MVIMMLTFAFCTFNRADRLEALVSAMRAQSCPIPFEILAVNNNSRDNTLEVLERLAALPGIALRHVTETAQGIVPARNRAISEALCSDILVFIDDDELPTPGLLDAACDAIINEGAQCVGGRVQVDFTPFDRPRWLSDDLLGFLAEVEHGDESLWLTDDSRLLWTANIAYDMRLFRDDPDLRFDRRYNRVGVDVGGGEDAVMFRELLSRGTRMRYRPEMKTRHFIEEWRLQRMYFLRLHYRAGLRFGEFSLDRAGREVLGLPPFLLRQFFAHMLRWLSMSVRRQRGALRQGMNAAHCFGSLRGYLRKPSSAATAPETPASGN
jgi:glycosyltransferase involved in cell wall biosynthesis